MKPRYSQLVSKVKRKGFQVNSRFGQTTELLGQRVVFQPGEIVHRPGMSVRLGLMEMVQLIGGVYNLDSILQAAPKVHPGMFPEQIAYGPRLKDQVPILLNKLTLNSRDRQAVAYVSSPSDHLLEFPPCAVTFQAFIRHHYLHGVVYWRSWDLVKGLAHDQFMFQGLIACMAKCLGVNPGTLTCVSGSLHLYSEDDLDSLPFFDKHRRMTINFPEYPHNFTWSDAVVWGKEMTQSMNNWDWNNAVPMPQGVKLTEWKEY